MAGIWPHIVAINWRQHAGTAIAAAQGWLTDGFTFLSVLPRDCVMATAHATMVCTWSPPEYTIPGFGPLAIGWGWLLLGAVQGAMLALLFMYWTGRVRGVACAMPDVAQMVRQIPAAVQDAPEPPQDVLAYLAAGGREALQDLAARANTTGTQLLQRVFGVQPQPQPVTQTIRQPTAFLQNPGYQRAVGTSYRI